MPNKRSCITAFTDEAQKAHCDFALLAAGRSYKSPRFACHTGATTMCAPLPLSPAEGFAPMPQTWGVEISLFLGVADNEIDQRNT
jgi:hypothetical protein